MSKRRESGDGSVFPWRRKNKLTGELEQVGWCGLVDQGIVDGKRRRMAMYAGMNEKNELVGRLKRAVADHSRGVLPRGGHVTVEQWLDGWLRGLEGTIRPRTLEGYEV